MVTITELTWSALTKTVNEIKSPNQFLKKLLFGTHQSLSTETIEISVLKKGREIAPFVLKNGAALMVGGHTATFQTVEAPNIRIKRPFTPSELLYTRRPGTVIFPTTEEQAAAIREHVSRDMIVMADLITNAEEWLVAMAVRGVVSYAVADQENFTITFPKPAGNTVTLTGSDLWDDADPNEPNPEEDFHTAKKLISDEVGLGLTHAVMGEEAALYFRRLIKAQPTLDKLYVDAGRVTLNEQFTMDGAIFLGMFCGVACWEYSRSASLNGVDTPMIRSKYVEFVCANPAAENTLYYGSIPDMAAMANGRPFVGERFSKSWEEDDPSGLMALVHSRPLAVPRRPGSMVSMKVVSG